MEQSQTGTIVTSQFSPEELNRYRRLSFSLRLPRWQPPDWVFDFPYVNTEQAPESGRKVLPVTEEEKQIALLRGRFIFDDFLAGFLPQVSKGESAFCLRNFKIAPDNKLSELIKVYWVFGRKGDYTPLSTVEERRKEILDLMIRLVAGRQHQAEAFDKALFLDHQYYGDRSLVVNLIPKGSIPSEPVFHLD